MSIPDIRVIIADDHPVVCDGLEATLNSSPYITVTGIAANFIEVLTLLETVHSDVLVLDICGMGGAPLTLVTRIRREYPDLAIVVFSSSIDLAPELLQMGVYGYVIKEELSMQLIDAVCAAYARQPYLSPTVEEHLLRTDALHRQYALAPQELKVLQLLSSGLGTSAIAEELSIDPRSAQNYITTLRRKTGCRERTQLVEWYRQIYYSQ
ncbi:MAG: response regulator transcription factor [Chloroflexota bacterium]